MKNKIIMTGVLAAAVGVAGLTGCASDKQEQATITKEQATQIARTKVPGGTIKEAELEKEKGKLIWSFDIATEGTKNITEVNVDAITGDVIAVDVETPEKEAKEKD